MYIPLYIIYSVYLHDTIYQKIRLTIIIYLIKTFEAGSVAYI